MNSNFFAYPFLESPQDFKPYSQSIPGSDQEIEMIPISGGDFEMGPFQNDQTLIVHVDPFWIGKFEITWDQYDLFVKENISEIELSISVFNNQSDLNVDAISIPTPPYVDMSFGMGKDGFPAINMTHYAAIMFTKWLYIKTGIFYRLPTEAEWEFACRVNHKEINNQLNIGNLSKYAWYKDNSERKYHKVGSKKPSSLGIYDLLGNVSEWTMDQFQTDYTDFFDEPAENPYIKPESLYPRTVRGGSWMDGSQNIACTNRVGSEERWQRRDPQLPKSLWWLTDAPFVGFRIVRPDKQPTTQEMENYWIRAMEAY